MSFTSDVKAFVAKAKNNANETSCIAIKSFTDNVIDLSPYKNMGMRPDGVIGGKYSLSAFKGSWFSYLNSPGSDRSENPDPTGAQSKGRVQALLQSKPFLNKDNKFVFVNNTPYADRIENKGWPEANNPTAFWYRWTGEVTKYAMVSTATVNFKSRYSV